jgi:hypothetical protein
MLSDAVKLGRRGAWWGHEEVELGRRGMVENAEELPR